MHGGIIDYARQIQEQGLPNKFHGKNFVFDDRLGESISGEVISHCHQCGGPSDRHTNCQNTACNLLFLQCPACADAHEGTCSPKCQSILHLPEDQREEAQRAQAQANAGKAKRFHRSRPAAI